MLSPQLRPYRPQPCRRVPLRPQASPSTELPRSRRPWTSPWRGTPEIAAAPDTDRLHHRLPDSAASQGRIRPSPITLHPATRRSSTMPQIRGSPPFPVPATSPSECVAAKLLVTALVQERSCSSS
ncbi:hypothetical protein ZWY2020_006105 [Hordeum vulgare]|nr:hypothetical protein ZWY2020_006105 [Hordeum vulgare]